MTEKEKFYRDLRDYLNGFMFGIGAGVIVFFVFMVAAYLGKGV